MANTPKEATVYVQKGSPWITCCCPVCGKTVYRSQKFCPECGQALSFNDYRIVSETGGHGIKLPYAWQRIVIGDAVKLEYITRTLKKLEAECQIEDGPILRIMREAYIKTCLETKG